MSIQKSCEQEVIELHQFFQAWLGGTCEESDQIFERVAQVLSEQFSMVGPDGQQTTREPMLQGLRVAYGSRPELGIWIKAFQSHHQEGGLIVATYEEWQEA